MTNGEFKTLEYIVGKIETSDDPAVIDALEDVADFICSESVARGENAGIRSNANETFNGGTIHGGTIQ